MGVVGLYSRTGSPLINAPKSDFSSSLIISSAQSISISFLAPTMNDDRLDLRSSRHRSSSTSYCGTVSKMPQVAWCHGTDLLTALIVVSLQPMFICTNRSIWSCSISNRSQIGSSWLNSS
jgi:hypothetical protein